MESGEPLAGTATVMLLGSTFEIVVKSAPLRLTVTLSGESPGGSVALAGTIVPSAWGPTCRTLTASPVESAPARWTLRRKSPPYGGTHEPKSTLDGRLPVS